MDSDGYRVVLYPFDMAPVLISKTAPEDISLFQSLVNRSRISWVTFVKHRRLLVEFGDEIEMTYYIAAGFLHDQRFFFKIVFS